MLVKKKNKTIAEPRNRKTKTNTAANTKSEHTPEKNEAHETSDKGEGR